jgi:predicted HicB family RNase H-like nuclease
MNTRMPEELKRQVEEYAERHGVSVNAATCVLLADALRADKRRR